MSDFKIGPDWWNPVTRPLAIGALFLVGLLVYCYIVGPY